MNKKKSVKISPEVSKKRFVKKDRKLINILIIGGLIVAIGGIWGAVALSNKSDEVAPISTQQIERSISGKSADEDRKDALAAATKLLNLSMKSPSGAKFDERLSKLDKEDFSDVDPEILKLIRIKDNFVNDKGLQANTHQSLATFATLLQFSDKDATIAPMSEQSWKKVYVDSEIGVAFVPLSIFGGDSLVFSFEMVYSKDSGWQLSPYSMIDAVKLSASFQVPAPDKTNTSNEKSVNPKK